MTENEEFEFRNRLEQEQAGNNAKASQPIAQPDTSGSFPEARAVLNSDQSLPGKAWDALKVPGQMAERGLSTLSEGLKPTPEITGNLPRDVIMNYPSVSANVLSKVAPGFVSRGALLMGGLAKGLQAMKPLTSAIGNGAASQLESLTGAKAGSISGAFEDPTLMAAPGKAAASGSYEAGKALAPGENLFAGMYKPEQIIDTAKTYLEKGGQLEPEEALIYRKALDIAGKGRVVKDALIPMRQAADATVKSNADLAQGDALYKRGVMADSLRNLLPQNKYGGASAFKLGIMAALENMGVGGKAVLGLMSPAAAGTAATIGGVGYRAAENPQTAAGLQQLYQQYVNRKNGNP